MLVPSKTSRARGASGDIMDDQRWTPAIHSAGGVTANRAAPAHSSVLDVLALIDAPVDDPAAAAAYPAPLRRLHTGETLFHEGSPAASIYFVRAGTFKTFATAEDGYEQVLGFALRTELLGFDAVCMGHHPTATIALEESSVYSLPVRDLFGLGRRIPALEQQLHRAASIALARSLELADVMAALKTRAPSIWTLRPMECAPSPISSICAGGYTDPPATLCVFSISMRPRSEERRVG